MYGYRRREPETERCAMFAVIEPLGIAEYEVIRVRVGREKEDAADCGGILVLLFSEEDEAHAFAHSQNKLLSARLETTARRFGEEPARMESMVPIQFAASSRRTPLASAQRLSLRQPAWQSQGSYTHRPVLPSVA